MPRNSYAASNNLTKEGAERLARTVNRKWRQRFDISVNARVEAIVMGDDLEIFVVKSDLVNGLPPNEDDRKKFFSVIHSKRLAAQSMKLAA